MARASIRLHGDLDDFLPASLRVGAGRGRDAPGGADLGRDAPCSGERSVVHRTFDGRPAVKDVLEAVGVPHPEIGAITVNGAPAGFGHRLRDGDRVEAWPAAAAAELELSPVLPAEPEDSADPRFVADGHLGRLAAYLRMLGFDTWYRTDAGDAELAAVAAAERRILLTRDRGLLKRSVVRRGAWVRADLPVEQLVEVARRFGLADRLRPFGRCLRCNAVLVRVSREEVLPRLEPLTRAHYDDFRRCPGCDAIYWKGSHHARMGRLVDLVRSGARSAGDR